MKWTNSALFAFAMTASVQAPVVAQPKPPIYELTGCTDSAHNFCKVISEHQGSKSCEAARKIYLAKNPGNNAICNKKVVQ